MAETTTAPVRCDVVHHLKIKGISRPYKLMHVTDVHIATAYPEEPDEMQAEAQLRGGQYFPPFGGFTAGSRFPYFFQEASSLGCDGILLTGDVCDFPSRSNRDILLNALSSSSVPAVYCLGNHDWSFLTNYHCDAHARKYLPEYERIVNYSSPAASSINSDLVCSSVFWKVADFGDFLIFAFDNGCDRIAPETLEMFRKVLKADKPVIVMCHVPFYSPTLQEPTEKYWGRDILLGGTAIRSDDTTRSFIELLTTKESPVCAVVAGHIHFNHEDMLGDNVFQFTTVEGHRGNYGIIEITGY